jgi:hypothetical protein
VALYTYYDVLRVILENKPETRDVEGMRKEPHLMKRRDKI